MVAWSKSQSSLVRSVGMMNWAQHEDKKLSKE